MDLAAELQRAAALPADLARQAARAGLIARLDRQLRARHAPTRGRAALLLAQIRLPDGVRRLERLLDDEDPVRLVTVAGLPLSQDPAAVHALVRALSHRRLAPERVIERVGRPWAVPPLLESLERLDAAGEPGPPRGSGSHARSAWPAICGRSRR